MDLLQRIENDLRIALKAKQELRLSTLRLLKAALRNRELETAGGLDSEQALQVLATQIKQRRQSIESFEQAGRPDLAAKELAEIAILETYLPAQLGAEELTELVRQTIAEVGAGSVQDFGRVMKALMPKVRGAADGKAVSELVRRLLS